MISYIKKLKEQMEADLKENSEIAEGNWTVVIFNTILQAKIEVLSDLIAIDTMQKPETQALLKKYVKQCEEIKDVELNLENSIKISILMENINILLKSIRTTMNKEMINCLLGLVETCSDNIHSNKTQKLKQNYHKSSVERILIYFRNFGYDDTDSTHTEGKENE